VLSSITKDIKKVKEYETFIKVNFSYFTKFVSSEIAPKEVDFVLQKALFLPDSSMIFKEANNIVEHGYTKPCILQLYGKTGENFV